MNADVKLLIRISSLTQHLLWIGPEDNFCSPCIFESYIGEKNADIFKDNSM
jgi:hypothetical protein